jgi:hypothetical protein
MEFLIPSIKMRSRMPSFDLLLKINPKIDMILWLDTDTPQEIKQTLNHVSNGLLLKNQSNIYQFDSWGKKIVLIKSQDIAELKKLQKSVAETFNKNLKESLIIAPSKDQKSFEGTSFYLYN